MGTSRLNVWVRDKNCVPLTDCWRLDLVVQTCGGSYLVDFYSKILDQLSSRYGKPATVKSIETWPVTDQGGNTVEITFDSGTPQTVNLTTPATTIEQIVNQINGQITSKPASIVDGQILLVGQSKGYQSTISVGGTAAIAWGTAVQGEGFVIKKLANYQGATRISIRPPSGEYINHVELDVPPGCYRVWARCCFGRNEETNIVMVNVRCDEHACVNLLLNAVSTCANHLIHPFMDVVVNQANFDAEGQIVPMIQGMLKVGIQAKQNLLDQVDQRVIEAQEKGDTELEARLANVRAAVVLVPDCQ